MKQKYEYWLIRSVDLQKHEDAINKKAKDGWEAVSTSTSALALGCKGVLGEEEDNGIREMAFAIKSSDSIQVFYVTLMRREKLIK